jgi:hypothetical protein
MRQLHLCADIVAASVSDVPACGNAAVGVVVKNSSVRNEACCGDVATGCVIVVGGFFKDGGRRWEPRCTHMHTPSPIVRKHELMTFVLTALIHDGLARITPLCASAL